MRHIWKVVLKNFSQRNHELGEIEKKLDELGRQIQMTLLRESLMPNSRDDLLGFFKPKLDKVPRVLNILLEIFFSKNPGNSRRASFIHEKHAHTYTFSSTGFGACNGFTFSDLRSVRQHVEEVSRRRVKLIR
ncbi:MAG: hypothetical protein CM1200mP28_17240 [Deltaproteobacteria bacterium]|nr:MAG: hypothetical protein CM1200mP28_17240 [Deltaproteobacteria bacterium]